MRYSRLLDSLIHARAVCWRCREEDCILALWGLNGVLLANQEKPLFLPGQGRTRECLQRRGAIDWCWRRSRTHAHEELQKDFGGSALHAKTLGMGDWTFGELSAVGTRYLCLREGCICQYPQKEGGRERRDCTYFEQFFSSPLTVLFLQLPISPSGRFPSGFESGLLPKPS